jgi:hypothetical protein
VVGHVLGDVSSAACHEPQPLLKATHDASALADVAEHVPRAFPCSEVHVVCAGAEVDVVAEYQGCLVAVDGAAHVGEEADVVQHGELGRVESESIAQPQTQSGGANHVLGRLTETEVGSHRDGDEHLVESDPGRGHSFTLAELDAVYGVNASWLVGSGIPTLEVRPTRGHQREEMPCGSTRSSGPCQAPEA